MIGESTPALKHLFATQNFSDHEIIDVMGLLGRVLCPNKLCDDWQMATVLIGRPRTGKSTAVNVVNHWFKPQDIGKLMPTMSGQFGASALVGKYVVVIPEGSKSMNTARTELNVMFSAEPYSFDQKHRHPIMGDYFEPKVIGTSNAIVTSGTNLDLSLSTQRRIMYVEFDRLLAEQDFGGASEVDLHDDLSERERASLE